MSPLCVLSIFTENVSRRGSCNGQFATLVQTYHSILFSHRSMLLSPRKPQTVHRGVQPHTPSCIAQNTTHIGHYGWEAVCGGPPRPPLSQDNHLVCELQCLFTAPQYFRRCADKHISASGTIPSKDLAVVESRSSGI